MGRKRKIKETEKGTEYYCTKCNIFKTVDNFEIKKKHNTPRSHCKECRKKESAYYHRTVRLRMTKEQAEKDIKQTLIYKADPKLSLKKYILRLTKNSARVKNLEHAITIDDINLPDKCPILNIPFILGNSKYTYSVDRVDNKKGYIPNNIRVISNLANSMKRDATFEELKSFSKNILNYIKI